MHALSEKGSCYGNVTENELPADIANWLVRCRHNLPHLILVSTLSRLTSKRFNKRFLCFYYSAYLPVIVNRQIVSKTTPSIRK